MSEPAPGTVSFAEALRFWLKLGFISFGGPAGQIAIMHTELVERRRWISEQRFLHALNYCMLLPGPEAQQLATYLGWLMHRSVGGVVAGALFVLPSLAILIALTWIYLRFGNVPLVAGVFYGLKPAVTAIVLHAAHRIGSRALKNRWMWGLAAAAFVAIFAFDVPFPAIVAAAALVGAVGARAAPQVFATGAGHGAAQQRFGPALIDDDTPTPPHARFSPSTSSAPSTAGSRPTSTSSTRPPPPSSSSVPSTSGWRTAWTRRIRPTRSPSASVCALFVPTSPSVPTSLRAFRPRRMRCSTIRSCSPTSAT